MEDGKFHPHTTHQKGVRKSRDQKAKTQGVRFARGDNNSEILSNTLASFNRNHTPMLEYGSVGGKSKFILIKDTQTKISPLPLTKSEAIDFVQGISNYLHETQHGRFKRDEEFPLDTSIERVEKDFEKALKLENFNNPKMRNQDWDVDITYEGGFSEEYFNLQASIVGTDKVFSTRTFISNFDWSEGLDEDIQKKIETNDDFAQKEYDKWLVDTFDTVSDAFYDDILGAIEEE